MRFKDRIAVITGGGRSIGKEIVESLSFEGAKTVIADIDFEAACRVSDTLSSRGYEAIALRTDVSESKDVEAMAESTLKKYGRIDIMVNNAGVNSLTSVDEMTKEEWDRVMDINLWGVFMGCRAVYKRMMEQRYGKIVNISSFTGKVGGVFSGMNYSASKAGVLAITKSFAKMLAPYNVNVNAICPGPIDTAFHEDLTRQQKEALRRSIPLGRWGQPRDVAELTLFLASDSASFITGAVLDVNGGILMD